jgi:hypothetical protein
VSWGLYRKKHLQEMRPHVPGEDMAGISVSELDKDKLTQPGGMIARDANNHADQWYVAADFVAANYEKVVTL